MAEIRSGMVLGGTWKLTAPLGEGGMGAVWAADHVRLPRQAAVKILHGKVEEGSPPFVRFRREAEIACRLAHPHIVDVWDFNLHDDNRPYLVMERLRGESLAARLRRGPLRWEEAAPLARQIASALYAAHAIGVVHRDLKPENIFLCDPANATVTTGRVESTCKVVDFGISKMLDSASVVTRTASLVGTPAYMAPEQAMGTPEDIGPATDQFALGLVLYEMLAMRRPFGVGAPHALLFRVVHEPHDPLGASILGVPPEVESAIDRTLAKEPRDRFPSLRELVVALGLDPLPLIGAEPTLAPDVPSPSAVVPTVGADISDDDTLAPHADGHADGHADTIASDEVSRPSLTPPGPGPRVAALPPTVAPERSLDLPVAEPTRAPAAAAPAEAPRSKLPLAVGLALAVAVIAAVVVVMSRGESTTGADDAVGPTAGAAPENVTPPNVTPEPTGQAPTPAVVAMPKASEGAGSSLGAGSSQGATRAAAPVVAKGKSQTKGKTQRSRGYDTQKPYGYLMAPTASIHSREAEGATRRYTRRGLQFTMVAPTVALRGRTASKGKTVSPQGKTGSKSVGGGAKGGSKSYGVQGKAKGMPSKARSKNPELAVAQAALNQGKLGEALTRATRAYRQDKSSSALGVILMVHCRRKDLAKAQATLNSLGGSSRWKRRCRSAGLDI